MCRLETFTDRILVWRRQVRREMAAGLQWNQPREKWDAWDPMLLSEGLFSAANIFSSLKLVYIFSVNPHLGPLQVSLSRMVLDILKFFVLDILVIFAFSCGKYNTNIYISYILYQSTAVHACIYASNDKEISLNSSHSARVWRTIYFVFVFTSLVES